MDRRGFLKGGALAAVTAALKPPASGAREHQRDFALQNPQLAWHLRSTADGIRSVAFENRISGRRFALQAENEFRLTFSSGQRIEIPWWDFRLGDETPVSPERETGVSQGFHTAADVQGWRPVYNLAGGQHGRAYGGYGWFRCKVELPESAKGRDIVLVLGGYDEQDWNDYWVYLNGQQIGRRTSSGRWRKPGRFTLRPSDSLYTSLRFGSSNLLAVRTRAYNFHLENTSEKAVDRYVFRPWLFDQFVSIGDPFLPISHFELQESHQESPEKLSFNLYNPENHLRVNAHYELNGIVRRKWLEITNESDQERLLLDAEVDAYQLDARRTEGGQGDPVFIDDEAFLAIAHPAGINEGTDTQIRLWHSPGTKIQPGKTLKTEASLVGVTARNKLLDEFHSYIISQSPRNKTKHVSLYTCYGINNQWGPCPPLTDVETLNVQKRIKGWQSKDVKFDYFTLDQGWPDNDGDLTQFASACYPDGPEKIVEGVKELDMKLGLWFSVSGGGWSDGSYPAVQTSAIPEPGASGDPPTTPPVWSYRDGYPTAGGIGRTLCIASDPYFNVFKHAVDHHVQHNGVRLVKFDIGNYYCNSTAHQHMPGRYSTEMMFNRLIDLAGGVRSVSPDVFVVWYWGVGRSPFWALHGDVIFESGLFLEGSGTSWYPTLFYRDAVTLALDQSTVFASLVPPLLKDSLGVWLSQIRWANFMGKERWREAMVMDLGRGNLMFPQIWGDPYLLNDDDLHFLSGLMALARNNEQIFLKPRRDVGDPWKNTPYGYSFFDGRHGFVFLNNVHFTSRKMSLPLSSEIGLSAQVLLCRLRAASRKRRSWLPGTAPAFRAAERPRFGCGPSKRCFWKLVRLRMRVCHAGKSMMLPLQILEAAWSSRRRRCPPGWNLFLPMPRASNRKRCTRALRSFLPACRRWPRGAPSWRSRLSLVRTARSTVIPSSSQKSSSFGRASAIMTSNSPRSQVHDNMATPNTPGAPGSFIRLRWGKVSPTNLSSLRSIPTFRMALRRLRKPGW